MNSHYLSCAETAALIRDALKRAFPGVKFSVRSKTYSGGASIDVAWVDGPTQGMVNRVAGAFAGGRFDGSIDLKYGVHHWMMPDGSIAIASDPGTLGSKGSNAPQREWMPEPGARLVHFGADYVFCNRGLSERFVRHAVARLARCGRQEFAAVAVRPPTRWMGAWIENGRERINGIELDEILRRECERLVIT